MAYMVDQANGVAALLERFTTSYAYQVAGQFANLEFWLGETIHALDALEGYSERFERLSEAQTEWIGAHNVVVGSFCPACKGQCEFEPELQRPQAPTKIPSSARNEAILRLRDAAYYFLLRCFRMKLLNESSLRSTCARIGTGVEARDLTRE